MVRLLLERGATVEVPIRQDSALIRAASLGRTDIARLLLEKADAATIEANQDAMHLAAYNGHAEMIRLLLAWKLRIDVKDMRGDTPLLWACGASRISMDAVTLLLDEGANVNAQGLQGCTPRGFCPHIAWRNSRLTTSFSAQSGMAKRPRVGSATS